MWTDSPVTTDDKPAEVVLGQAGASPAYWYRAVLWNVLMSADQTLGEFTLLEQVIPAGAGPPAHVHERQAEGFYVISGELELVVGAADEVMRAGPEPRRGSRNPPGTRSGWYPTRTPGC